MIRKNILLDMSHVGLGTLTESGLMLVFGSIHSERLTNDIALDPKQIVNSKNEILYPAYYFTHLSVPPSRLLRSFNLWDRISVGVDVFRFGKSLLESSYILSHNGEISQESESWGSSNNIFMKGSSIFVVDSINSRKEALVGVPSADSISNLPAISSTPEALHQSRSIRRLGQHTGKVFELTSKPIAYRILPRRDVSIGRSLVFAKFIEIMDTAEYLFLLDGIYPGLSISLVSNLAILERKTYYFGNASANEVLEIYFKLRIESCSSDYHGNDSTLLSCGLFEFEIEIYSKNSGAMLVSAYTKKLLIVPVSSQNEVDDCMRIVSRLIF